MTYDPVTQRNVVAYLRLDLEQKAVKIGELNWFIIYYIRKCSTLLIYFDIVVHRVSHCISYNNQTSLKLSTIILQCVTEIRDNLTVCYHHFHYCHDDDVVIVVVVVVAAAAAAAVFTPRLCYYIVFRSKSEKRKVRKT